MFAIRFMIAMPFSVLMIIMLSVVSIIWAMCGVIEWRFKLAMIGLGHLWAITAHDLYCWVRTGKRWGTI